MKLASQRGQFGNYKGPSINTYNNFRIARFFDQREHGLESLKGLFN
jgi:hypothetical protein